jgi:hypothetical protein
MAGIIRPDGLNMKRVVQDANPLQAIKNAKKDVDYTLGKRPQIATATVAAPPVMPVADDEAAGQARRRRISRMASQGGRSSTILSGDTLG